MDTLKQRGTLMDIKFSSAFPLASIKHERSEDYKVVYSNAAFMNVSFFDASITFGEVMPTVPDTSPHIADRVTITMSWEHLKALHNAIGSLMENFEKTNQVKIRQPPTPGMQLLTGLDPVTSKE
jgi:hypothetical protein